MLTCVFDQDVDLVVHDTVQEIVHKLGLSEFLVDEFYYVNGQSWLTHDVGVIVDLGSQTWNANIVAIVFLEASVIF